MSEIQQQQGTDNNTDLENQTATPDITGEFLSLIINKPVCVKLFNDFVYTGTLSSIDGYMNVVLQDVKEIVNGDEMKSYDELFLRGNSLLYIGSI